MNLWGNELWKHQLVDLHLRQTILSLFVLLRKVQRLLVKINNSTFFLNARFGKKCKQLVVELNNVDNVLGLGVAYMNSKQLNETKVNTGEGPAPLLDTPSLKEEDDGEELCLDADKYYFGHGVIQSDDSAFRLYLSAARLGNPKAQYTVGNMYLNGVGTARNDREGVKFMLQSAEQGYSDAINHVGILYESGGSSLEKDELKALKFFKRASEKENLEGMTNLSNLLLFGSIVPQSDSNIEEAISLLKTASERDFAKAQNILGHLYYTGSFVDIDYDKAVHLFKQAAERGDIFALNNLGICYEEGNGVEKDFIQAAICYDLSSRGGNVSAINNLGYIKMIQNQYDQARLLLHDGADRGSVDALYNLAVMYDKGMGTHPNIDVAFDYYCKAADKGHKRAQNRVGDFLYTGIEGVVPCDRTRAARYYKMSAVQGFAQAQNSLGIMYEEGVGVQQSDEEAFKWFTYAATQNFQEAVNNLYAMEDRGAVYEIQDNSIQSDSDNRNYRGSIVYGRKSVRFSSKYDDTASDSVNLESGLNDGEFTPKSPMQDFESSPTKIARSALRDFRESPVSVVKDFVLN
ncbi:hypothetical protein AKO1_008687 [Acrasis kona]|uniref:Uncharacterized protein n=1 Tax=Acrasis kona TaxID=1008807 RepID=A0AAW2ZED2_9EUKA